MIQVENINENFIFPQINVDNLDIKKYLESSKHIVRNIQDSNVETHNCCLSFYPLAKNIRFISTHFFLAVKSGRKPSLSNHCRRDEDNFWRSQTGDNWYPWLWTRYLPNLPNIDSWRSLFLPFEDKIEIDSSIIPIYSSDFYLYLSSLQHVFRTNNAFNDGVSHMLSYKWPENPVCGLQIRRGEIVPSSGDVNKSWGGRKLYTVDEYMEGTKKICSSLNTKDIFVSTDSLETIDYLIENYKDYNFLYNKYDRSLFMRYDGSGIHLEYDLRFKPDLIKHYTESCMVDLMTLSKCDGYVGGMKFSEYGICGWFLQMARQGKITPYFNIEGELELFNKQVGMLLL